MIGYLQVSDPGHSDKKVFRSYQCGLCHCLGAEYGFVYRLFASVDMVAWAVLLDAARAQEAPMGRRACVMSPLGARGPTLFSRERTAHTEIAAALAVWFGGEKLKDDLADEGGLWRRLAWGAFSPGHAKARARLAAAGFPIAEAEGWMRRQAEVERGPALPLSEAVRPTEEIAALTFGFAAGAADGAPAEAASQAASQAAMRDLGRGVGRYLFFMDNLLDYSGDVAGGRYNALARVPEQAGQAPGQAPAEIPAAVRAEALGGLRGAIAGVEAPLAVLPLNDQGRYLRRAILRSFQEKQHSFLRATPAQLKRGGLKALKPEAPPLWGWLVLSGLEMQRELKAAVGKTPMAALRLLLAFLVLNFFPRSQWAAREALTLGGAARAADTGDTGGDTGGGDTGDTEKPEPEPEPEDSGGCGSGCTDACNNICNFDSCCGDSCNGCGGCGDGCGGC